MVNGADEDIPEATHRGALSVLAGESLLDAILDFAARVLCAGPDMEGAAMAVDELSAALHQFGTSARAVLTHAREHQSANNTGRDLLVMVLHDAGFGDDAADALTVRHEEVQRGQ